MNHASGPPTSAAELQTPKVDNDDDDREPNGESPNC